MGRLLILCGIMKHIVPINFSGILNLSIPILSTNVLAVYSCLKSTGHCSGSIQGKWIFSTIEFSQLLPQFRMSCKEVY